jgi:lon-related putative ATP-dependent protease
MPEDIASRFAVAQDALCRSSDAGMPAFERSDELESGNAHLGQDRAVDALRFGIEMDQDGYNVFVLGPPGSHRHGLAMQLAEDRASQEEPPDDWCYVHNFADPDRPRALSFPAGQGGPFRADMRELIEEMRLAIPAAFEGDDYRSQLKAVEAETQKEIEEAWHGLKRRAEEEGIGVLQTPTGYVLAPIRDGKVLDDSDFKKLPEDEQEAIKVSIEKLHETLQHHFERMPALRKRHRERLHELNRDVTEQAVGALLIELKSRYSAFGDVVRYLEELQTDLIENAEEFLESEAAGVAQLVQGSRQLFGRYDVNLLVSSTPDARAPVVYETNPSFPNVIGKIEHRAQMGTLTTDFRLIRAGALHRANGGYLILDMHRVLSRPFVWEALKQALFSKRMGIESPGETYGFFGTTTLRPEPIPLDIKIILVGERWHYYLLSTYDPEFLELFRVAAELDDDLERSADNVEHYARLVADRIRENKLLSFDRSAMMRVVEQRARRVEDSERLSTHMRSLDDLLMQADYWARRRNADAVSREDVSRAVDERRRRVSRAQHRIEDAIARDVLLIDTGGDSVGQVNGLSVITLGDISFGHPVRITATTRVGSGEVVDIEREVELGGAIHSKGMLILSAALAARYAPDTPLSLNGSVVFEQTYGGVDGDSASVAEYCALVSSLSRTPIRQNLAVTGSINQHGRVQVVGGINEKVEGFFDVCQKRGLDGSHGVVIPADNVKHLMLREDVVEAVEAGRFGVYAVCDVDDALTLLTGVEAGKRNSKGHFPDGSVNQKAEAQLIAYAEARKQFSDQEDGGDDE